MFVVNCHGDENLLSGVFNESFPGRAYIVRVDLHG